MSRTYREDDPNWTFLKKVKKIDKKPYQKPNSKFKKNQKRKRKAKEKEFFKKKLDNLVFKKTDRWDWL